MHNPAIINTYGCSTAIPAFSCGTRPNPLISGTFSNQQQFTLVYGFNTEAQAEGVSYRVQFIVPKVQDANNLWRPAGNQVILKCTGWNPKDSPGGDNSQNAV